MDETPLTSISECVWPAIPAPYQAGILAAAFQLEQTQWWSAERLAAAQCVQLQVLLNHAYHTVPFYRQHLERFGLDCREAITPQRWRAFPFLRRRDIQLAGQSLYSTALPDHHGPAKQLSTSGSTNTPVTTLDTAVTAFYWHALTVRDHRWHRRDLSRKLAVIRYVRSGRAMPPSGEDLPDWGPPTGKTFPTGPSALLNVMSTIDEQADWLVRHQPGYVLGYPSALVAIGHLLNQQGRRLMGLHQVRTFGEILEPQARTACQQYFGAPVIDLYSSQEVGTIAIQCPDFEHYHVQAENLLVEVLNDFDQPCLPGETGRVVITTLHNFAMPLLRYDIGDYAEVGEPCPCGRGLPVLKRILGRQRNLLVMPDGTRRWPIFDAGDRPEELPPFFQFQVIQRSLELIEVLVVRHQPFSPSEASRVKTYMQQTLGYPFDISLRCVESIARSRTGKFEDFVSDIS